MSADHGVRLVTNGNRFKEATVDCYCGVRITLAGVRELRGDVTGLCETAVAQHVALTKLAA